MNAQMYQEVRKIYELENYLSECVNQDVESIPEEKVIEDAQWVLDSFNDQFHYNYIYCYDDGDYDISSETKREYRAMKRRLEKFVKKYHKEV